MALGRTEIRSGRPLESRDETGRKASAAFRSWVPLIKKKQKPMKRRNRLNIFQRQCDQIFS